VSTLTEPRPEVAVARLQELLGSRFGVVGELTELHSERDRNYLVTTTAGQRSILKVHNPAEPVSAVDMQTAALAQIAAVAPDLPICRTVPTTDGEPWTEIVGEDGRRSLARMLTFLDGHHPRREELDETGLYEWGRTAARLGRALRGFFHPEAGWETPWDIRRFPSLRAWAPALADPDREMVVTLLDRFDERVSPALSGLRAQLVHNDLSRGNVLVDDSGAITGITDFGDMTHTALVCDLAVTLADVLDGRDGSIELAPAMIAGYHSVTTLEPEEIGLLPDLIAARCAAALTITAWRDRQAMSPPEIGAGARQLLNQLLAVGLDTVSRQFTGSVDLRSTTSGLPYSSRPTAELLEARRRALGPLSLTYRTPLHVVRGEGAYLYGANGERWLDAYNNVPVLGHSHPAVAAATAIQLHRLNTNSRYLHEAGVELAERLLASMPGERLDRVLLINSGSEANDLAWRIAQFATGATGGIVTSYAYHGVTSVTTDLSPEAWGKAVAPDHIELVEPPPSDGAVVATAIADLDARGHRPAAMFVDGVFTSDGVRGPAHDWTTDAINAVHAAGGLYVADEVQAGFGRTGDHLWSWAAGNLQPDLVTLGKPMGNGYPVAAVIGASDLIDPFIESTEYFSTYGGGTVASVAALAVLRAIDDEDVVARAQTTGRHLVSALDALSAKHTVIGSPRGWGLAVGVDVIGPDGEPNAARATWIVDELRDRGVLLGTTGPAGSTLKIRPPLVIAPADCDHLVATLDEVLGTIS